MADATALPAGWSVERLDQLAEVTAGSTAPQGERYFTGELPFVRVQHLDPDRQDVERCDFISEEAVEEKKLRRFPAGTIVLPKSGASIRLEKRALLGEPSYLVSHLCAVLPYEERVNRRFLFYVLRALRLAAGKSDGYPVLNLSEIRSTPIPLPPEPVQEAIVETLERVAGYRRALEALRVASQNARDSLSNRLFRRGTVDGDEEVAATALGPLPKRWRVAAIGKLLSWGPQNGLYKPASFYGEGIQILRIDDYANSGAIVTGARRRVALDPHEVEKFGLREGDLLVNRVNSLSHLGKTALVGRLPEEMVFESNMMRFRVDEEQILPEYAFRFLSSPLARAQMRMSAKRAVAQSSINQGDVGSILCPLPCIDEQERIVHAFTVVDAVLEAEANLVEQTISLEQALSTELLCGKRQPGALGGA